MPVLVFSSCLLTSFQATTLQSSPVLPTCLRHNERQDHHHERLVIDFGSSRVLWIMANELLRQAFHNQATLDEVPKRYA
jgi:hypothetical protein